jgi:hypothetical protein
MTDLSNLVKPLAWEKIGPHHAKALLPLFGNIRVESWGGPFQVVWSVPGMCDTFTAGKFESMDDAKSAAQSDYATRIISALAADMLTVIAHDAVKAAMDPKAMAALIDEAVAAVNIRTTPPNSFDALVADAKSAAAAAMAKQPQPNYVITKFAEEAGEVVKDAVHCAEGRQSYTALRGEMVQALAMMYRLWVEGDQVHGLFPVADMQGNAPEVTP